MRLWGDRGIIFSSGAEHVVGGQNTCVSRMEMGGAYQCLRHVIIITLTHVHKQTNRRLTGPTLVRPDVLERATAIIIGFAK